MIDESLLKSGVAGRDGFSWWIGRVAHQDYWKDINLANSFSYGSWNEIIDIAFNVNYLQEILSSIDSENVIIHFFGSDKSCLITSPDSENYKYVVMPLLI